MTRRIFWHAAQFTLLILTVPLLALLCRGHAPSRFAASNLPFWQRALPHPAHFAITMRRAPAAPGAVRYDSLRLQDINENQLLTGLEHPSARPSNSEAAGRAGQWLEAACALGRKDTHLRRVQDDVAERLMNAQDPDGYLAAGKGRGRWSPVQVRAFGQNLRGLLSFYAVSSDPAAIYAAMHAGDLVVSELSPAADKNKPPDGLLLPMTRLYLATGEPRYRAWALNTAAGATADGPGLAAAYELTGQAHFLRAAERLWERRSKSGQADAELSAVLWAVTGTTAYLQNADTIPAPWVCPLSGGTLTYTRTPAGLDVNAWVDSSAALGPVRLTQRVVTQAGSRTATIRVHTARARAFKLRLFVPPGPGVAKASVVGATKAVTVPRGTFWVSERTWKEGDTVVLTCPQTPQAARPAGRL